MSSFKYYGKIFFNNKILFLSGLFSILVVISTMSFASESKDTSSQISKDHSNYPVDFFDQYNPQNAFDMIERLPGFTFDSGQSSRGFGGNAGNVLIDGVRPTLKSGGLEGVLKRIPANQIERIEIMRGGVNAGDTAGQSIIANVIKRKNFTSGTYGLVFKRAPHGEFKPNIEATITTMVGQWDTTFDTNLGYSPSFNHGEINRYDANNALIRSSQEERDSLGTFSFLNGQMSRGFELGKLTFNGRLGVDKWKNDQVRKIYNHDVIDNTQFGSQWKLKHDHHIELAEFGVDWVQTTDNWKWHSLILGQIETRQDDTNALETQNGVVEYGVSYQEDRYKSEYIARNTYGYVGSAKFKPEFGVEIARNYLNKKQSNILNDQVVNLPNANVEVSENRAEVFASFVYTYNDKLSIDGGLTAEFSKIEVIGDTLNDQSFDFLKPRLSTSYKLNDDMNLIVKIQHVVGQLNFNHFAASSSAQDNRDISGNSELKPEQSTEFSSEFDWAYSEKGSFKVKAYHYWKDDILEEIVLSDKYYGRGNAGSARVWGANIDLTIPTDGILDNGLLKVSYNYSNSIFTDSIIDADRPVNGQVPHSFYANFRQDLVEQKLAWGLAVDGHYLNTQYHVDEISQYQGHSRFVAFIETSYFDKYKLQLEVSNIDVTRNTRSRFFYKDTRNDEYRNGLEVSESRQDPVYKLSVWGRF